MRDNFGFKQSVKCEVGFLLPFSHFAVTLHFLYQLQRLVPAAHDPFMRLRMVVQQTRVSLVRRVASVMYCCLHFASCATLQSLSFTHRERLLALAVDLHASHAALAPFDIAFFL